MAVKRARYSATNQNLLDHALAPTMRWLIATALDRATMTYGQVKHGLESEANFSTIFATRIGLVAGVLMHRIQDVAPDAPLINVLVVNQKDQMPSHGAGAYMAKHFGKPRLASEEYKKKHPEIWRKYFEMAATEVYAYSPEDWSKLYQAVFDGPLTEADIGQTRQRRHDGKEDDSGSGNNKYGPGGESNYHKDLRLWVTANPGKVRRKFADARTETEFCLDSGDRVDAVYHLTDRTVVLEVKSRISNEVDIRRGVFQCVKYRAVKEAMDARKKPVIDAYLVTETEPSGDIVALLRRHDIKHFLAPQSRT